MIIGFGYIFFIIELDFLTQKFDTKITPIEFQHVIWRKFPSNKLRFQIYVLKSLKLNEGLTFFSLGV